MRKRVDYPTELNELRERGFNMAGFVPFLYSVTRDYPKGLRTVVEIGTRGGISTNALLYGLRDRGHSNAFLHSFDIADCSKVVKDETIKKNWKFTQGESKTVPWDKEIDVLLIDGDHSYSGVKADYEKWMPFVKEGGMILMHDVLWAHKGVIKFFWDEVALPKISLPFSKSGMGVVSKITKTPYDESKINLNHVL